MTGPGPRGLLRILVVGAVVGLLTPVRVYPDSVNYLISARSLFSSSFASDYFWLREPLYPAFLRLMSSLPPDVTLHSLPAVQGAALALGTWLFASAAVRLGVLRRAESATYYALTCLLVIGYTGALLQQTFMVLAAGALAWCAVRLGSPPAPTRRLLVAAAATSAFAVLLSAIFIPAVALLPLASLTMRRRPGLATLAATWGAGAACTIGWALVRWSAGQPLGLGGAAVLDRTNTTDGLRRIEAFLATFGLAPDFFDGSEFGTLSYSNVALSLNPYFGSPTCVGTPLRSLAVMPDTYAVCGSWLPALPPGLLPLLTAVAVAQLLVGVVALVWTLRRTDRPLLYLLVLALTVGPCLPVAVFLADGNSRYGLPVLSFSLVLTVAMATHRRDGPAGRGGSDDDAQVTGLRPTQSTL